jgi:hypothetical protein
MYVPARSWASVNDTPAARTLTRTSPGPGRGSSSSTTLKTPGPPNRSTTTRFMAHLLSVAVPSAAITLWDCRLMDAPQTWWG